MFIACWSSKGGSGATVVAAGLGLVLSGASRDPSALTGGSRPRSGAPASRRDGPFRLPPGDTLLIDLAGDLPAVLGVPEPEGPGVAQWLAAGADVPADGLARIEVDVVPGLSLLPRGRGPLGHPARAEVLAGLLGADGRHVVVDCGVVEPAGAPVAQPVAVGAGPSVDPPLDPLAGGADDPGAEVARVLAASATQSLLVTRACYLALRRFVRLSLRPSGVVLLTEPGRSLTALDVEELCGAPVVTQIAVDPSVARAVDAGLLSHRIPRGLARALRQAA